MTNCQVNNESNKQSNNDHLHVQRGNSACLKTTFQSINPSFIQCIICYVCVYTYLLYRQKWQRVAENTSKTPRPTQSIRFRCFGIMTPSPTRRHADSTRLATLTVQSEISVPVSSVDLGN